MDAVELTAKLLQFYTRDEIAAHDQITAEMIAEAKAVNFDRAAYDAKKRTPARAKE